MSLAREGDCTTKTSVVVQISRRQDLCQTCSYPRTHLFVFTQIFFKTMIQLYVHYLVCVFLVKLTKIAALGEGGKPNPKKVAYVAESEIALLSILCIN